MVLHFYLDLPIPEVAAALGVPVGTAGPVSTAAHDPPPNPGAHERVADLAEEGA